MRSRQVIVKFACDCGDPVSVVDIQDVACEKCGQVWCTTGNNLPTKVTRLTKEEVEKFLASRSEIEREDLEVLASVPPSTELAWEEKIVVPYFTPKAKREFAEDWAKITKAIFDGKYVT